MIFNFTIRVTYSSKVYSLGGCSWGYVTFLISVFSSFWVIFLTNTVGIFLFSLRWIGLSVSVVGILRSRFWMCWMNTILANFYFCTTVIWDLSLGLGFAVVIYLILWSFLCCMRSIVPVFRCSGFNFSLITLNISLYYSCSSGILCLGVAPFILVSIVWSILFYLICTGPGSIHFVRVGRWGVVFFGVFLRDWIYIGILRVRGSLLLRF